MCTYARAHTQLKAPTVTGTNLALRECSNIQLHKEDMYPLVGLLCALSPTQLALVFLNNRTAISL